MRRNNRGFTLVELMVVIAIIGVLTAIISLNISVIFSTDARRAATTAADALSTCRQDNRSREGEQTFVVFTTTDTGKLAAALVVNGTVKDCDAISTRHVDVTVGNGKTPLSAGTGFFVSFTRGSGAVKMYATAPLSSLPEEGTAFTVDESLLTDTDEADSDNMGRFRISSGSRTYVIAVDMLTGKVTKTLE